MNPFLMDSVSSSSFLTLVPGQGHVSAVMPAAADFTQETWWIALIKAVALLVYLIICVLMALWVERRLLARIQTRPGPNVHGPFGLFQALADALKMVMKEDMWLRGADKVVYFLAPTLAAFTAFTIFAIIPMGPNVNFFGWSTPLQMFDSEVATLVLLAIAAVGIYAIVLGGWAANSPYPLLGSVRSTAQVISYELAMGTSLLSVFLMAGSMSTSKIVDAQTSITWLIGLLPAFMIYMISAFAETNRLPFDLTECESELVAGHMTEYSGMKFAWFYLAEYINIFNVSAVATTMFLGGYKAPWSWAFMNPVLGSGWWGLLWFNVKLWALFCFFVWVRGTLVRFRYDQFMNMGWKRLIPIGFIWLMAVAWIQALPALFNFSPKQVFYVLSAVFVVMMIVVLLIPTKKVMQPKALPFDPFADGYPVPPMPGQELPPSLRSQNMKVVNTANAGQIDPKEAKA